MEEEPADGAVRRRDNVWERYNADLHMWEAFVPGPAEPPAVGTKRIHPPDEDASG